jgi:hypothetical protein
MIDTGLQMRPKDVVARIEKSFQCSAFATGLADNFVECVFSIRLMHHIEKSADRVTMLKEFPPHQFRHRNRLALGGRQLRAWRHRINEERKRENPRQADFPRDRFVFSQREIEADIAAAGLKIVGHVDFVKYWEKWRAYVLRVNK